MLWILLNFFPIGWAQLDAVFEHGLAYARSQEFYDKTLFWQWMRFPGDVVFALGALLMAWDFIDQAAADFSEAAGRDLLLSAAGAASARVVPGQSD